MCSIGPLRCMDMDVSNGFIVSVVDRLLRPTGFSHLHRFTRLHMHNNRATSLNILNWQFTGLENGDRDGSHALDTCR